MTLRLAVLCSHPVQYHAPLLRELARQLDLHVYYGHRATSEDQARAGFDVPFEWDVDLLSGYPSEFLANVAKAPGSGHFSGVDTPGIGTRLAAARPDALLVMGWHLKCYWQAIRAARRLGIPVIVRGDSHLDTPRGLLKQSAKALFYPPALRVFDAALYVGQKSRAYYEHYGYPRERLVFSPHCVDNAWFASRALPAAREDLRNRCGIRPEAKVALFAGKLMPLKRPFDVIDAAAQARLRGLDLEVLIAGSGELESAIRERAADRGVPLHMLGFRNQTEMPSAYTASDMLVLLSAQETWGLVANESLACGRPIIVSAACGCAPDLAADGIAGRMVPTGDIVAIANAMHQMATCPPSPSEIEARSRMYSIEAAAAGILRAAQTVASRTVAQRTA